MEGTVDQLLGFNVHRDHIRFIRDRRGARDGGGWGGAGGGSGTYRAIQAGLTPLTFARHRLSPLAAFTSGAYFLHNGRR